MTQIARAIFQIPPFPGAQPCEVITSPQRRNDETDPAALIAAMRRHRIGGTFWATDDLWGAAEESLPVRAHGDDPRLLLGAIAGRPLHPTSEGTFSHLAAIEPRSTTLDTALAPLVAEHLLTAADYADPFDGAAISALDLVEILGGWRQLIAANQPIVAAFGFAHWKRDTVDPLLWGGSPVPFRPARPAELAALPADGSVAVWKARVPATFLAELEAGPWHILEVEDGFIRSAGLGADCVPPLSIVVDDLGVHYDCTRPSRLEDLISRSDARREDLNRARTLREWLVSSGLSKYGVGRTSPLPRNGGARRHVLVVGQVEDDRSVLFGSAEVRSNLELLQRVRAQHPEAWIIYRPHPDVEAGHRKGAIPERTARAFANQIEPALSISALIALVDEIHVMTSLAGFEALLHSKAVTTHGTPFFAGWGLTHDLAPAPKRRGMTRSIDELTAAVLLRYPRYVDPVTNLPCTAEILVKRLLSGVQRRNAALVPMRRLVGWAKRVATQLAGTR